jgi:hypothetical protein
VLCGRLWDNRRVSSREKEPWVELDTLSSLSLIRFR